MKSKTKIIIIGILLLAGTSIFGDIKKANAAGCSNDVLKYFPINKIAAEFGTARLLSPSTGIDTLYCHYGNGASAGVVTEKSAADAKKLFKIHNNSLSVGDDSYFSDSGHTGYALKGQFIFSIYWYCGCSSKTFITAGQAKDILTYAVSQVPDTIPTVATKSGPPIINSISHANFAAGVQKLDPETGFSAYASAHTEDVTLTGKNFKGVVILSPKGIDNLNSFFFSNTKISDDGSSITFSVDVYSKATEGKNTITVLNIETGERATIDVSVFITGTQYLSRKFANENVYFMGQWSRDNPDLDKLAKRVTDSLGFIKHGSYKKLPMRLFVFEDSFWEKTGAKLYCTDSEGVTNTGFEIAGCATKNGPQIYFEGSELTMPAVAHEAAHKLHFYNLGKYPGLPSSPSNFQKEWTQATGNIAQCKYLPLKNGTWSDGSDRFTPHCGFIEAYGALETSLMLEDVATYVEINLSNPKAFYFGDASVDPRYKLKLDILKKYGFL